MATTTPTPNLTPHDTTILTTLFNPEALSPTPSPIDPTLPAHPTIPPADLHALDARQKALIRAVQTDPGCLRDVMQELDAVVAAWPGYGAAFANRAMLRRMVLEVGGEGQERGNGEEEEVVTAILADLTHAIQATLPPSSPQSRVSAAQALVLRTAYAHRAYTYLKAADTGVEISGFAGTEELEEAASRDFGEAARFGDGVAGEMSVRTNAVAKMCGAVVRGALREEMGVGG